ncbi:hypothetical protein ABW20_dc0102633 [Dactylellina cionopaga]|nr:hypothetical protein ABW20_dc0102633 [Dactylellina cionopaga]
MPSRISFRNLLGFTATSAALIIFSTYHLGALPYLDSQPHEYVIHNHTSDASFEDGHFLSHTNWTIPSPSNVQYIERLFLRSYAEYRTFLNRQSQTYAEAVANYRKRYGRDPPAGFEEWYRFAKKKGCLVIDDYDVIENSIKPYRSIPPGVLKRRMQELKEYDKGRRLDRMIVRDGTVTQDGNGLWQMLDWSEFVGNLPDMDAVVNAWDEPFVLPMENSTDEKIEFFQAPGVPLWPKVQEQCKHEKKGERDPKSTGRYLESLNEVKNALELCGHPEYEGTHGFFNAPTSLTATRQLLPIFSVQTMSVFKDLLLPSSSPFHPSFLGNDNIRPFDGKIKDLYWRGSPTGGELNEHNWFKSHRVRLALLSRTAKGFIDAKLTGYFGSPKVLEIFEQVFGQPEKADKKDENNHAYLMDMDGNGQSGRYYRLLRSKAVVFKVTAFQQWHDDRLFPWVHYVPVKLGMPDLVEILRWLSGTDRGWEVSRRIAEEGDWWTRRALRVEDAQAYVYRMLLEYADLFKEK